MYLIDSYLSNKFSTPEFFWYGSFAHAHYETDTDGSPLRKTVILEY